jgi:transposase
MTVATRTLTLEQVEVSHIAATLLKNGGRKPAAAAELGISLKTLYNKINRHHALSDWRGGGRPTAAEVPTAFRLAEAPIDMEEVIDV